MIGKRFYDMEDGDIKKANKKITVKNMLKYENKR